MDLGKKRASRCLRIGTWIGRGVWSAREEQRMDEWVIGWALIYRPCLSVCLSVWLLLGRQSALFCCCRALVLLRWFVTYLLIPILMSTTIVLMMCSVLSCPLTRREGVGMYLLCCCWRRGTYILCSPTNSRMSSKVIKRIFGISWHW
jgi:hypothetical protein